MLRLLGLVVVVALLLCRSSNGFISPRFAATASTVAARGRLQQQLYMSSMMGGLAEKLGSIVELVSGQQKITEANIEDTLKVLLLYSFLLFQS